jgi:hypothetical protein
MSSNRVLSPGAVVVVLIILMTGIPAAAQNTLGSEWELEASQPTVFGTDDPSYYYVSGEEFTCIDPDDCTWRSGGSGYWYNSGPGVAVQQVYAPLHLPAGALVDSIVVVYYDGSAGEDINVRLVRFFDSPITNGSTEYNPVFVTSGTGGYDIDVHDIDDFTVQPWKFSVFTYSSYHVRVLMPKSAQELMLHGVIVRWYRQVSPAPATATFNDVPTGHLFFRYIEALADSGITAGCGGGSFCPDGVLTRGQMAVFLAKALGLHWKE